MLLNILSPLVILGTLDVGRAILTFASLSFLGLGPPPQVPEWGTMIAAGRDYLDEWWIATFPGLAILTLVLALNAVGDSLRDTLDPRLRRRVVGQFDSGRRWPTAVLGVTIGCQGRQG